MLSDESRCASDGTCMTSNKYLVEDSTPELNSVTELHVAERTRSSPTKFVFGHFVHTFECRESLTFCVWPSKQAGGHHGSVGHRQPSHAAPLLQTGECAHSHDADQCFLVEAPTVWTHRAAAMLGLLIS